MLSKGPPASDEGRVGVATDDESDGSVSPPPSPAYPIDSPFPSTFSTSSRSRLVTASRSSSSLPIATARSTDHNTFPDPTPRLFSLLVMGSGGSAAVPDIACVTKPETGCECCVSAMRPQGWRNKRGNTGAVLTVPQPDGSEKCILIDCGKTFRERALALFPRRGLRKIDAVILTHHHADAIDGLDDLRAWTYKDAIEKTIPIYCTQTTFTFISDGFPYLMSKKAASGGGALPSFKWNIFDEDQDLVICGLKIVPLPVHHGRFFTTPPTPLVCMGYLIDSSVLYMSDVSYIPPKVWRTLESTLAFPDPLTGNFSSNDSRRPRLQALVIDCTGLSLSASHYGLPQALELAHRLGVRKTYLTNLSHRTSHECWLYTCLEFGKPHSEAAFVQSKKSVDDNHFPIDHLEPIRKQPPLSYVYEGFDPRKEDYEIFRARAFECVGEWLGGALPAIWVRPLCDGMSIAWEGPEIVETLHETVWDDEYH